MVEGEGYGLDKGKRKREREKESESLFLEGTEGSVSIKLTTIGG